MKGVFGTYEGVGSMGLWVEMDVRSGEVSGGECVRAADASSCVEDGVLAAPVKRGSRREFCWRM